MTHTTTAPSPRRLPRLAALAAWTELRSSLRAPEFAVGALGVPILLYAMFGLPNSSSLPGGTPVDLAMLVSICAYGTISMAIFVFGEDIAKDRGRGWTRTLRATPVPSFAYLAGKVGNALLLSALVVIALCALAAIAGGVRLEAGTWLALGGTMLGATILFAPLGFAIAFLVRPRAAMVIANLIFLPLAFASGFFLPLSELPEAVQVVAPFLPTFHFGQLAYPLVMSAGDVEVWTAVQTSSPWIHAAWLAGAALVLSLVAVAAARREGATARG